MVVTLSPKTLISSWLISDAFLFLEAPESRVVCTRQGVLECRDQTMLLSASAALYSILAFQTMLQCPCCLLEATLELPLWALLCVGSLRMIQVKEAMQIREGSCGEQ